MSNNKKYTMFIQNPDSKQDNIRTSDLSKADLITANKEEWSKEEFTTLSLLCKFKGDVRETKSGKGFIAYKEAFASVIDTGSKEFQAILNALPKPS